MSMLNVNAHPDILSVAIRSVLCSWPVAGAIALAEFLDPLLDVGLRQPVKHLLGWNFSGLAQIRDGKLALPCAS